MNKMSRLWVLPVSVEQVDRLRMMGSLRRL